MIGRCDPITKKKRVKKKGKKRDSQLVKLRFAAFVLFLSTFLEQLQYSVIFVEMQEKLFKQPKGLAVCELQAASPLALP